MPHWMSMGMRVTLTCSSETARDGLDVSPLDGLFELVALVVAGRRDRRERAAPSEGRTMRNRLPARPPAAMSGREVSECFADGIGVQRFTGCVSLMTTA